MGELGLVGPAIDVAQACSSPGRIYYRTSQSFSCQTAHRNDNICIVQWGKQRLLIVRGDWSRLQLPQVLPSHLRLRGVRSALQHTGWEALLYWRAFTSDGTYTLEAHPELSIINHHTLALCLLDFRHTYLETFQLVISKALRPWTSPEVLPTLSLGQASGQITHFAK